ncbi:MAG: YraN family protein [Arenicellales bacterium WSBS_2016_MAG_OTU3]
MRAAHLASGDSAEELALQHLQKNQLKLITRNYSSRYGEIDLIMQDKASDSLVFVEVRYRKNQHYGTPAETVTMHKQRKLILTAEQFLQTESPSASARFDVVAITGSGASTNIEWLQNAFDGR